MTLREFLYARLRDEVLAAEAELMACQAAGPPHGLHLYPMAHLRMQAAQQQDKGLRWLIERRLWDTPRLARVQTMKALAYQWRAHPDYLPEWSTT